MKNVILGMLLALVATPAFGVYYVAGDFNGWNAAGNAMTDMGGGIWQVDLTGIGAGRHEFKVTIGDWSQNWPGSGNSWLLTDAAGNVSVTWDANATHGDGWLSDGYRIGVNVDPGTWTAVGDWQGWNNANPATAMVAQGGGIYKYQQTLAPGTYQYKAVNTGSWDAIGADFRSINADTASFTTDAVNDTAVFWVNALNGTIKVDVVPEPATLGLILLGGLGLLRRRAR
jgi:hypothetical protein